MPRRRDLLCAGLSRTISLGFWVALCRPGWGEVHTGPRGRLEHGHETPAATHPLAPAPKPRHGAQRLRELHGAGVEGVKTPPRLPQAQSSPGTARHPALGHLRAHPGPHSMTVTLKIRCTSALWQFGLFGPDDSVSLKFRFNYITNVLVKHYRAHRPPAFRQGSAPAPGLRFAPAPGPTQG